MTARSPSAPRPPTSPKCHSSRCPALRAICASSASRRTSPPTRAIFIARLLPNRQLSAQSRNGKATCDEGHSRAGGQTRRAHQLACGGLLVRRCLVLIDEATAGAHHGETTTTLPSGQQTHVVQS